MALFPFFNSHCCSAWKTVYVVATKALSMNAVFISCDTYYSCGFAGDPAVSQFLCGHHEQLMCGS